MTAKILIFLDIDLESYYQLTLEYLDRKYHTFPTEIPDWAMHEQSPEIEARIEQYTAAANQVANNFDPADYPDTPIGKLVL